MAEAGFHRFPLPLDPTAQEFRPTYVYYSFPPPPAFIIPCPSPPPLPPSSTVPTRALLLSSVPTNVSESTVRRELEVFGDVRAVQMERLRDGIVTVHFYDLRQATEALNTIQQQHMRQQRRLRQHFDGLTLSISPAAPPSLPPPARGLLCGRVIWAQFAFPLAAGLPDRYNQGTVVIILASDVSTGAVRDVFEAFGDVKEIRETPWKNNQKFVEFYDTRDATKAAAAVNGHEIDGKLVVVELIRPGGHKQKKRVPRELQPPPIAPFRKDSHREVKSVSPPNCLKKNVVYKPPEEWVGGGRNKAWKGARYNNRDPRFLIKGDAVVSSFQDSRTTVMIRNIPNKYSQKLLLNMLDNHCIQCNEGEDNQPLSSYDFVYLPIDFVNKCNVGYGFVNMTSPEATQRLYKAFNHQNWEVFNSKKICEVSYARLQGVEALKEHFKNSKFPCSAEEEYMPVVFTPPRDGRTVTEPMPVVGRSSMTSVEVAGDYCRSSDNNLLVDEDTQSDNGGGELKEIN